MWICLMVAGLAACESVSTRSDHDPAADFSGYRTYAWVTEELMVQPRASTDPSVSPLVQQRIHDAIDRALGAKGFVEDPASPDFVVAFTVGLRDRVRVDHWGPYGGFYRPYGRYGGVGMGYNRSTATNYTEGTLAIDVFDGQTRRAVWNGSATKIVDERDDRPEEIQKIVNSILADFPPGRSDR
jgi:hypothetical protein